MPPPDVNTRWPAWGSRSGVLWDSVGMLSRPRHKVTPYTPLLQKTGAAIKENICAIRDETSANSH